MTDLRIDARLVRGLLQEQFPNWSRLPLCPVERGGKDHRMFRLGDAMTVRLPSAPEYVPQVEKEQSWLPRLAPVVPLPIPAVLGRGRATAEFHAPWSIYGWIEGVPATRANVDDWERLAGDLASFLVRLRSAATAGAPPPGPHSAFRGGPLSHWDDEVGDLLRRLRGREREGAARVWRDALAAPLPDRAAWFHGDVATANLLVQDGRLAAVIDFGCAGVGDTACDTGIAWTHLRGAAARTFRRELAVDDATWARGRGWAVWKGLLMIGSPRAEHAALGRAVLSRLLAGE